MPGKNFSSLYQIYGYNSNSAGTHLPQAGAGHDPAPEGSSTFDQGGFADATANFTRELYVPLDSDYARYTDPSAPTVVADEGPYRATGPYALPTPGVVQSPEPHETADSAGGHYQAVDAGHTPYASPPAPTDDDMVQDDDDRPQAPAPEAVLPSSPDPPIVNKRRRSASFTVQDDDDQPQAPPSSPDSPFVNKRRRSASLRNSPLKPRFRRARSVRGTRSKAPAPPLGALPDTSTLHARASADTPPVTPTANQWATGPGHGHNGGFIFVNAPADHTARPPTITINNYYVKQGSPDRSRKYR